MEKKIIYVAFDDEEFEDERECLAHEFRQKASKFGKDLRLWDENLNRLYPMDEDALEDAYYIYAGTLEARKFVDEYLGGLFEEVGWSTTFVGYINDNWYNLEDLYNMVSNIIATMED